MASSSKKDSQLIIQPKASGTRLAEFVSMLYAEGIRTVYADPKRLTKKDAARMQTVFASDAATHVVLGDGADGDGSRTRSRKSSAAAKAGQKTGRRFQVLSNADIDRILASAESEELDFVIVEVKDWKIIPLENIIAKLHKIHTRIFAIARTPAEVRKMFSILDVGVDGVIFSTSSMGEVRDATVYLGTKTFEMAPAKITEIKEVGDGERVCVDTVSMLERGEGMLVGSRSNFLFLVHNESVGSSFTSPRPFRVNAGAVHCYTLAPDGTTKYLSEMETGSEILVLNPEGGARRTAVGRSKIERRPLLMIKASADGETGGIMAQDAETIRFVRPDGQLVSVTHLKKGDTVMVHARSAAGRHFGMEVSDEYILEK